jgi:uncharacterized protein YuzE
MVELMKINIDKEANAAYIEFTKSKVSKTEKLGKGINADYDLTGELIGIEIYNLKNADLSMLEAKGIKVLETA